MNGMPYIVESLFDSGVGQNWVKVGFFANLVDAERKAKGIWIRRTRVVKDGKVLFDNEVE